MLLTESNNLFANLISFSSLTVSFFGNQNHRTKVPRSWPSAEVSSNALYSSIEIFLGSLQSKRKSLPCKFEDFLEIDFHELLYCLPPFYLNIASVGWSIVDCNRRCSPGNCHEYNYSRILPCKENKVRRRYSSISNIENIDDTLLSL